MEVEIRKWQKSDIDNLVLYANNKSISDKLADAFPYPYTKEFGQQFIERVSTENPTRIFAIELDSEHVVGSIGVFPDVDIHRKNAAIAYWVAEPYWGKGIATQAIALILEYAFNTFDITRVYAKPFGSNQNSHKVLEKAGFVLETTLRNTVFKNGVYLDERIYSLTKDSIIF